MVIYSGFPIKNAGVPIKNSGFPIKNDGVPFKNSGWAMLMVSHPLTFARKVFPAQAQPEATLATRGRELRAAHGQLGHGSFPKLQVAPGPLPIHLLRA